MSERIIICNQYVTCKLSHRKYLATFEELLNIFEQTF